MQTQTLRLAGLFGNSLHQEVSQEWLYPSIIPSIPPTFIYPPLHARHCAQPWPLKDEDLVLALRLLKVQEGWVGGDKHVRGIVKKLCPEESVEMRDNHSTPYNTIWQMMLQSFCTVFAGSIPRSIVPSWDTEKWIKQLPSDSTELWPQASSYLDPQLQCQGPHS